MSHLVFALISLFGAMLSFGITVYAWNQTRSPISRPVAWFTLSVALWCFFSALEHLAVSRDIQIIFAKLTYIGIFATPISWFIFCLAYTHQTRWLSPIRIILLAFLPITGMFLALTNEFHLLIWTAVEVHGTINPHYHFIRSFWFENLFIPYSYILLLGGFGLLMNALFNQGHKYRRQLVIIICSVTAVICANLAYLFGWINLDGFDPTPLSMAIATLGIARAIFAHGFLLTPSLSYRKVFDTIDEGIILVDDNNRILDTNISAELRAQNGISPLARFDDIFPQFSHLLDKAMGHAHIVETQSGASKVHTEIAIHPLTSNQDNIVGKAIILRDVTSETARNSQLEDYAYIDSLTGLANRRRFYDIIGEIDDSKEDRGNLNRNPAVIYIDLNRFKEVNDRYGHEIGDRVLQTSAERITAITSDKRVIARIGGDEFIVYCEDEDQASLTELTKKLRQTFDSLMIIDATPMQVGVSVGYALYPTDGTTSRELMHSADNNMYKLKQSRTAN